MKKSNWKSTFVFGIVAIASTALVSFATYQIVKIIQKRNVSSNKVKIEDWNNVSKSFKIFSRNNSFKVEIQSSPIALNGGYFRSQGTAWSWYYKQTDNLGLSFDWYLMTNFHVVNESVANVQGLIGFETDQNNDVKSIVNNYNELLNYYKNNTITIINKDRLYFSLSRFEVNGNDDQENQNQTGQYRSILSTNSFGSSSVVPTSAIKDISIITDFNNDSINLFSEGDKYNLDISLIKISLKFNKPITNLSPEFKSPNVYDLYLNSNRNNENLIVSNLKKTYIAGNPAKKQQLIGVSLENPWVLRNQYLNYTDLVLSKLHAPYYFADRYYDNFPLSSGASGSSVYQFDDNDYNNIWTSIPLGIYWGGASITKQDKFKPSFIPFYQNNLYNIFNNFESYLNAQEN